MNAKAHISENGEYSYLCRNVDDKDVKTILKIMKGFDKPVAKIRKELQGIDTNCPHIHHVKLKKMDKDSDDLVYIEVTKLEHPLPCSSDMCNSKL